MGPQRHRVILPQKDLATANCGEKQQLGTTAGTPEGVFAPPLHIKLDLIKQSITVLDKVSAAFKCLQDFFLKLSEAKVKSGVFVGPQIKKIRE